MKRTIIIKITAILVIVNYLSQAQNIKTIAGKSSEGFSGDGGSASNALLNTPVSLATDHQGNLFIADFINCRVRKISVSTGIISTIAGGGQEKGDGVKAIDALLGSIGGIALDSADNIYITVNSLGNFDGGYKIRKIDSKTGIITTLAGTGYYGYSGEGTSAKTAEIMNGKGIYIDRHGSIFFADANRIRNISIFDSKIRTISGFGKKNGMSAGPGHTGDGGDGSVADLWDPKDIIIDSNGVIYIAEYSHIRKIVPVKEKKTTKFGALIHKAIDDGTISTGEITSIVGGGKSSHNEGGPGLAESFSDIRNICFDNQGNIIIVDSENYRVVKLNLSTGLVSPIAGKVKVRGFSGEGGLATVSSLAFPRAVTVDRYGNIYIADGNCIRMITYR